MDPIKPQPTLKGFNAWLFREWVRAMGVTQAEGAARIIDHWLEANMADIVERFGIKLEDYRFELEAQRRADKKSGVETRPSDD